MGLTLEPVGRQALKGAMLATRSYATDQNTIRVFSISSFGTCHEWVSSEYSVKLDCIALVVLVPTQAILKRAMTLPFPDSLPISYFVGRQWFNAKVPPLGAYKQEAGSAAMIVMAQWESAYTRQARAWRKRVSPIANVADCCADRLGRDSVVESIAGAHVVMYFGHGHHFGLDGYHGLVADHFLPDRPLGLFWSWSCNTIVGRNSFALKLLQSGVVKAYIGTINAKARSCDNLRLAQLSAEVLLQEQPTTLMEWIRKFTTAVDATGDSALAAAWRDYHVLGDITLKLPELMKNLK